MKFEYIKYPFFRFIGWNIIYLFGVFICINFVLFFIKKIFFKQIIYTYNSELLEHVDNLILYGKSLVLSSFMHIIGIFISTHLAFKQVFFKPYTHIIVVPNFKQLPISLTFSFYGSLQIINTLYVLLALIILDHNWILKAAHFFKYKQFEFLYLLAGEFIAKYSLIFIPANIIIFYLVFKSIITRNAFLKIK